MKTKPISEAKKMLLRMTFNGRRSYNDQDLAEKAGNRINTISTADYCNFTAKVYNDLSIVVWNT